MLSVQKGKLAFDTSYSGSTKNAIIQVLLGKADAGVTVGPALARETKNIPGKLRTLLESPGLPSHPLCAHPRIPETVRASVRKGIFTIVKTPKGEELMRQVRMPDPTIANYKRDYKSLESIDIKFLSNWGK